MITLRNIVQEYPAEGRPPLRVIDDISLSLDDPGIYALLGPSGCGKSTLMRMMGGVRPFGVASPTSGEVLINGMPCYGPHPDVVMVFQRYTNRPDLTVRQNVAFPFTLKLWRDKIVPAEVNGRVDEMLKRVGLADKAHLHPDALSGGQNQRVALARALVVRPRVVLMDEPFGALDAQIRAEMQELLISLWEAQKCHVVFVTHDVTEALVLGDRIITLSTSPARVALDFPVTRPRAERDEAWRRSSEATKLTDLILHALRGSSGHGQVRVSV